MRYFIAIKNKEDKVLGVYQVLQDVFDKSVKHKKLKGQIQVHYDYVMELLYPEDENKKMSLSKKVINFKSVWPEDEDYDHYKNCDNIYVLIEQTIDDLWAWLEKQDFKKSKKNHKKGKAFVFINDKKKSPSKNNWHSKHNRKNNAIFIEAKYERERIDKIKI